MTGSYSNEYTVYLGGHKDSRRKCKRDCYKSIITMIEWTEYHENFVRKYETVPYKGKDIHKGRRNKLDYLNEKKLLKT